MIRPAGAADATAIRTVVKAAFGAADPAHGDEITALVDDLSAQDLWRAQFVAEAGGEAGGEAGDPTSVVGHVGLSHAWLDARRALVDVWLLSPLSVLPEHQRRGVGAALLAAALEGARAAGSPLVFLEGSPSYYGSRGFERASPLGFEPASRRTPDAAFQVARLDTHEEWMTGRLIYRDVWWEHDSAGLRDPDLAALEQFFGRS